MVRKKRKPVTHVLVVIDRSGSMAGLVGDVRGGFNTFRAEMLAKEEAGDGRYRVTVALFDDHYELLANATPLAEVPELTEDNYYARGMTALLDAIGKTITDFEAATTLGAGDQVLLVVQTDGAENSSKEFTSGHVMEMLRAREALGWRTTYMGAGPQAWGQGSTLGFGTNVNTAASGAATTRSYGVIAAAAAGMSRGASYAETQRIMNTAGVDADDSSDSGGDRGDSGGSSTARSRTGTAPRAAV